MGNLKRILKLAIDENVPEIQRLQSEIAEIEVEKDRIQKRLTQLNVEKELKEGEVSVPYNELIGLMESNEVKKLTTNLYAVERCRDANPTVEVVDIALLPQRYIVLKPKADKRLIQTEFVNSRIIPPGVSIEYGQYLKIIEREAKSARNNGRPKGLTG